MIENENQNNPDAIFCSKCGWENPPDAKYCANCGFFLLRHDEKRLKGKQKITDSDIERPEGAYIVPDETEHVQRCPRCRNDIRDLDQCPVCGLKAPESAESPDTFFTDFFANFPVLLSSPERFVDQQPYFLGWIALIRPILWATLFAIISWVVISASQGSALLVDAGIDMPLGIFLLLGMTVIVLIFPWFLLVYIALLQLAARLVGGRGQIERTCRSVCYMLSGLFLILATLLVIYLYAKNTILQDPLFLEDSKWRVDFLRIPLIITIFMFLVQFFFLIVQIRLLARINYIEIWKSFAAHIIAAIPFGIYIFLQHYGYI